MQISNFLFHRVTPDKDLLWQPMRPELFERIIRYLSKNYYIIPLENFLLGDLKIVPQKKMATILFDDGFRDNIEYAAPILKKYNCPASFYIVTDCIGNNIPTWTYQIDYLFQHTKIKSLNLAENKGLPLNLMGDISTFEKKITLASRLKPELKKLSHDLRTAILKELFVQLNDVEIPDVMMNWKEVNQLKSDGFEIGSHSKSHLMLGDIQDEEVLKDELLLSAKAIEKNTGKFPLTISYPVGSYNDAVIEESKKSGYRFGLAVNQKIYDTTNDDMFSIPRMELYNESWLKTKLRMNGWLEKVKSYKKF